MKKRFKIMEGPFDVMLSIYVLFIATAFIIDGPVKIYDGFVAILTSRGVLITDYMAVGGIGATLINAAMVGAFTVFMLKRVKVKPNGSTIMALWLNTGFAMFGKNVFNMLPLTVGVWLFSRVKKEPFINFSLVALLSATLSPVVSGIGFHKGLNPLIGIPAGILVGIICGFIFAPVSSFTVRVHGGYNLYNLGLAGGLISTFIVAGAKSFGITLDNELYWSTGNNFQLATVLFIISAGLIALGLFSEGKFKKPDYAGLCRRPGRAVTDFYLLYGDSAFFNMGLLCALSTALVLVFRADLNGPTLAGIFTITGFAAFGKHLKNVTPVVAGACVCAYINQMDFTAPVNIVAILFSTGLAPIAGQYGWAWGLLAGYLHLNIITHIGFLNSGLNLYNNGYAAGLVALLMVPVIMAFEKTKDHERNLHE